MSTPAPVVDFQSTIWSQVAKAGHPDSPEARASLERLCKAYWYPVFALICRHWHSDDEALDLTQRFFVRLLEKDTLSRADRARGRFRDFLRGVCRNFLRDEHRRRLADVNGGGVSHLSIDAGDDEGRRPFEPADFATPDRLFEHDYALTLLNRGLDRLAREYAESGRAERFEHLKVALTQGRGAVRAAVLAERLSAAEGTVVTEGAVHQAIHRLKARYRVILREEVAATLDDPSQIDDEIRSLFDALRPDRRTHR
jgi:RNA polymerase sigma-70 factor (ECF subfamily)